MALMLETGFTPKLFAVFLNQDLEKAIRPDTSLVSIITVNNEVGVQQPVEEIGELNVVQTCVPIS